MFMLFVNINKHKRTQNNTSAHKLIQAHTTALKAKQHKRTQTNTSAHKPIQAHTNQYKRTQTNTSAHKLIQPHTSAHKHTHSRKRELNLRNYIFACTFQLKIEHSKDTESIHRTV